MEGNNAQQLEVIRLCSTQLPNDPTPEHPLRELKYFPVLV